VSKQIKIKDLVPDNKNYNKGTEFGGSLIEKSLRKLGAGRSILLDKNNRIIAGNKTIENAGAIGLQDVIVVETTGNQIVAVKRTDIDLDSKKGREMALADNATAKANIDWDVDALNEDWSTDEQKEWGVEFPDFAVNLEAEEDDYEIPDEIQTDIVLGDLFEIGQHRLLCGDSTNADDVAKLLQGKEPYLMVTDPPYGVEYDANWRNEALRADGTAIAGRAVGKVKNDDTADWSETWALSPSRVAYIYHAGKYAGIVQKSLEDNDFEIRSQIIWNKSNFAIGRGDYHWKHEPCWYAVKKGNKGNWAGDRKQTTVWDIPKPQKSETGHSTQKPVECMARAIGNHDGDCYEPFNGSGTTMVAGHQLGRKVYAIEIKPEYCQITIDRMQKLDPSLEIKRNGQPYISNKAEINAI
jgi:DNA modification methylase